MLIIYLNLRSGQSEVVRISAGMISWKISYTLGIGHESGNKKNFFLECNCFHV